MNLNELFENENPFKDAADAFAKKEKETDAEHTQGLKDIENKFQGAEKKSREEFSKKLKHGVKESNDPADFFKGKPGVTVSNTMRQPNKPDVAPQPDTKLDPAKRARMEAELKKLQAELDPNYPQGRYSFQQDEIAKQISRLKGRLAQGVAEGTQSTTWVVHYDYGPHQSNEVKVKASSEDDARAKAVRWAKNHGHSSIMINRASPAEQGVAENFENYSKDPSGYYRNLHTGRLHTSPGSADGNDSYMTPSYMLAHYKKQIADIEASKYSRSREVAQIKAKIAKLEKQGVAEGRFIEPKQEKPPKSTAAVTLKQLLKNKKENPGQSPFKTQDDKVKKYLGVDEGVAEGLDSNQRARLDDLIDTYRNATDPSDDGYGVDDHYDPDQVLDQIRQEFGDNVANKVEAGTDKMHFPRQGHSQGYDPMDWREPVDRVTKAGKMYKQDSDYRKNTIKSRYRLSGKSATEGVAAGETSTPAIYVKGGGKYPGMTIAPKGWSRIRDIKDEGGAYFVMVGNDGDGLNIPKDKVSPHKIKLKNGMPITAKQAFMMFNGWTPDREQGVPEGSEIAVDRKTGKVYNPNKELDKLLSQHKAQFQGMAAIEKAQAKKKAPEQKGVAESDISGLMHAAKHYNKSFLITAELAEGGKKTFRVRAQSERVAREKFTQHHNQARVISVKEEGVAEGSEWETRHDEFTTVGNRTTPAQVDSIIKLLTAASKKAYSKMGFVNNMFGKQNNSQLAVQAHGAETLATYLKRNRDSIQPDERKKLGQHLVYSLSLLKKMKGELSSEDEQGVPAEIDEASSDFGTSAEELNIGDPVKITGNVEFKGATGEIDDFGTGNRFVIVNLYNHGRHSFHSSDVSFNEYAGSDDEEARMYDADQGLFGDDDRDDMYEQGVAEAFADQGSGTTGKSQEDKRIAKLLQQKHKQQMPTQKPGVYAKYLKPKVDEKVSDFLPKKLGTGHDNGKLVRGWRKDRGFTE